MDNIKNDDYERLKCVSVFNIFKIYAAQKLLFLVKLFFHERKRVVASKRMLHPMIVVIYLFGLCQIIWKKYIMTSFYIINISIISFIVETMSVLFLFLLIFM